MVDTQQLTEKNIELQKEKKSTHIIPVKYLEIPFNLNEMFLSMKKYLEPRETTEPNTVASSQKLDISRKIGTPELTIPKIANKFSNILNGISS